MTSLRKKAACLRSVEVDGPSGAMPDGTGCQPTASAANASSLSGITIAVDDITDADRFPEIARAHAWWRGLSPERRAELNGEWE